jgi:hypothetical protein
MGWEGLWRGDSFSLSPSAGEVVVERRRVHYIHGTWESHEPVINLPTDLARHSILCLLIYISNVYLRDVCRRLFISLCRS